MHAGMRGNTTVQMLVVWLSTVQISSQFSQLLSSFWRIDVRSCCVIVARGVTHYHRTILRGSGRGLWLCRNAPHDGEGSYRGQSLACPGWQGSDADNCVSEKVCVWASLPSRSITTEIPPDPQAMTHWRTTYARLRKSHLLAPQTARARYEDASKKSRSRHPRPSCQ